MARTISKEEALLRFHQKHGNKYDYSKMEYINTSVPICIICPVHGEFWQKPIDHYKGKGCPKCGYKNMWDKRGRRNTEEWISLFNEKHKGIYNYSGIVKINNAHDTITISCSKGHTFSTLAYLHLSGRGCPYCANSIRHTKHQFIVRSKSKFGEKFDYCSEYVNNHTPVVLRCPTHGTFSITPQHHLKSPYGCPKCAIDGKSKKKVIPVERVSQRLCALFGDNITIDKGTYINITTECTFYCKHHGAFKSTPDHLLHGGKCPACYSSVGESAVATYLRANNYSFEQQYKVRLSKLFGRSRIRIDFMVYVGDKRYAIEVNGDQHYRYVPYFHQSEDGFREQKERDKEVAQWCKSNGITLIEISYSQLNKIDKILSLRLK